MKNILIVRELDDETVTWITQKAQQSGVSVEDIIKQLIYQGVEIERKGEQEEQVYHDLDQLAGTWDEEETAEFLSAIEDFGKINPDLWQ
jgi:hypothetical protein